MIRTIVLIAAFAAVPLSAVAQEQEERPRNRFDHDILVDTFGYGPDTPSTVEFDELYQGCPRRDCIPSIDEPSYVSAEEASEFLRDEDLVMAVSIDGDKRAWPIRILDFHEIVNDTVGGRPVAITWCPLCGSGLAFERRVRGDIVEFGVAGVLHGSDLVMYDRKTETLWQQITGEAIMGPALGDKLTEIPVTMTEWGTWREAHPDTRVLSLETGFDMPYRDDRHYADYEKSEKLVFPASRRDLSIHPKTVVHGFEIDGRYLAVTDDRLGGDPVETTFAGKQLTISRRPDGSVVASDEAGNSYRGTRLFWFAWFNFHPDTERI